MRSHRLLPVLKDHYEQHHEYDNNAKGSLIATLFAFLYAHDPAYIPFFFPSGFVPYDEPQHLWSLSKAQGALEGSEYAEAAKGKRCGHIFRAGEVTYTCRSCAVDETCVLCSRCFEASDHEGHQVGVHLSMPGATGCCDCGDPEAWTQPVVCGIHTSTEYRERSSSEPPKMRPDDRQLPHDLVEQIRETISEALNFVCDVFSGSSETMRPPKDVVGVQANELHSRLHLERYAEPPAVGPEQPCELFSLILWNDEKHMVDEVEDQVARACRKPKSYGTQKAYEVDEIGRSVVLTSVDIPELLRAAKVLEQIKVAVTIRSARDTYREEMCCTIINWLSDIVGCSVGSDNTLLMNIFCEELLVPWTMGTSAPNLQVGSRGIQDEERSDRRLDHEHARRRIEYIQRVTRQARTAAIVAARVGTPEEGTNDDMDVDEALDDDTAGDILMRENVVGGQETRFTLDETGSIDVEVVARGQSPRGSGPAETSDTPGESASEVAQPGFRPDQLVASIPQTPHASVMTQEMPPAYWYDPRIESLRGVNERLPVAENLRKRVRIDFLILYDMRMWKCLRNSLRRLYISTVVTVPYFKRVLGLRFAAVYTWLAQLHLIADREPEHSIIGLSLQMLTTASIATEVVEKENFLTKLLAILYTFLTKRQVGHPADVDPTATISFDNGALTNRRIHHFFMDMKFLLDSKFVQKEVREGEDYLLQFLDFVKLYQGICCTVRATGDHVEYESDAWISASFIGTKISGIARQFCSSFQWALGQDPSSICRAIRQTAKAAVINSMGAEYHRFQNSELRGLVQFKEIAPFQMEVYAANGLAVGAHRVVSCAVETEPMSFHHQLHHMLSWFIDCGKSMSVHQLRGLLTFTPHQLQLSDSRSRPPAPVPEQTVEEYLLAVFDIPLRVCVWMSQIKSGMWVRNGMGVRAQMSSYRNITQREYSFQRDIFLLQTAIVSISPAAVLASMIERFGVGTWVRGDFKADGVRDHLQMLDMMEDLIQLLTNLLSERLMLIPQTEESQIKRLIARREIAHALLFKPLSHSDLINRIPESVTDLPEFAEILHDCAKFRAPEGLQDSGTFTLQSELFNEIDPYNPYFSKNQREEAESCWRHEMSKIRGTSAAELVFEPQLPSIRTGVFAGLLEVSASPLFVQIIFACLNLATDTDEELKPLENRIDALLPSVLHLILLCAAEDNEETPTGPDFISLVLTLQADSHSFGQCSVLRLLQQIKESSRHRTLRPRIAKIFSTISKKKPREFELALEISRQWHDTISPQQSEGAEDDALAERKRQAKARQEKVLAAFKMQQNEFLQNQERVDWGFEMEDQSGDENEDPDRKAQSGEVVKEVWNYPGGTCIFCQEEATDSKLFGTLAYIANSRILRQTPVKDKDYVAEVCTMGECLQQDELPERPFGVAGQNKQRQPKPPRPSEKSAGEKRGLGRGFPRGHAERGPVATGCGHIMHFSCFETYNAATERRQSFQLARNHPERVKFMEFVCPLCKALGNAFLPILWKAKEAVDATVSPHETFEQWLRITIPHLTSVGADLPQYSRIFRKYVSETLHPAISEKVLDSGRHGLAASTSSTGSSSSRIQFPSFLSAGEPRDNMASYVLGARDVRPTFSSSETGLAGELLKSYVRLRQTLEKNGICSQTFPGHFSAADDDLPSGDSLATLLGFSIASVEIAHRGLAREAGTLVTIIPHQTISGLRVLSETTSSYIAVSGLRSANKPTWQKPSSDVPASCKEQIRMLLGPMSGFSDSFGPVDPILHNNLMPLLERDTFVFFAECSVFMVPHLRLDIQNVLRLCYYAEIVKVVLTFTNKPQAMFNVAQAAEEAAETASTMNVDDEDDSTGTQQNGSQIFTSFIQEISRQCQAAGLVELGGALEASNFSMTNPNERYYFERKLRSALTAYAVAFLRKCLILLHIRQGMDFEKAKRQWSETGFGSRRTELEELSWLLKLPSLEDMMEMVIGEGPATLALRGLIGEWISHWMAIESSRPADHQQGLQLAHPAIFELVGLPTAFDTLNAEAGSQRCPTTGSEVNDPCICLFCGEIFCGQAACCPGLDSTLEQGEGGCYRHQSTCGENIGMYINIKKCGGIFLNGSNGTWLPAPYLDKYGELDPGMRRREQQWLNRKRWDKLYRDVWLSHGVQTAVARKLEADINAGGWETL